MDLSQFGAPWQTGITTRLSTGTDEAGIVLDWLEAGELATALGMILSVTDDIGHGPRFEVRRAPDSSGPVIFTSDMLGRVDAFLDGVAAGKGGAA